MTGAIAGVEAEPRVRVGVQRPQRRRQSPDAQQLAGDVPAGRARPGPPRTRAGRGRRPARANAQTYAHIVCTCSLMPSSFSCSCSGFAPLRYGRARALVQRRRRCRRGASRARARRPSRAGRARGGASRRRTRRRSSPSANGSRSPSAWTRRYGPDALLEEAAAAEADQRVDDEVAGDVLAAARHEVLRGPALRRADLEHAVARPDVAVEQELEAVLGRAPGAVLPAEVAVQERQRRVDPVVGLVPALLAREHRPGRELAQLRVEPGRGRVEQARDAVVGLVVPAAGAADERSRRARRGTRGRRRTTARL